MPNPQNPVIVVPGITATSLHDEYPLETRDVWTMVLGKEYERLSLHPDDPRYETREPAHLRAGRLFSIYDDLIAALRHELTPKRDQPTPVFAFPYDWRMDLRATATELRAFVEEVIARTCLLRHYDGFDRIRKVDLVGHSMGGLLICEYLSQFGNDNRVSKVVTLGTPFLGSLEAVVKITTGMGNLSGDKPSERERETARTIPAIYQLLPSFDRAAVNAEGEPVRLFDPANWQRSVVASLAEYVRLHSVKHHKTAATRKAHAERLLASLLDGAARHRANVEGLALASAGLTPDDWMAVIGVGETTRMQVVVKGSPTQPRFFIDDAQFTDRWAGDHTSRDTGDGTVPLNGALPPFLDERHAICVCEIDFGPFEVWDRLRSGLVGFHGLLPTVNLVQRLTIKHLKRSYRGSVWGRRVPGATEWSPPIAGLREET